MRTNIKVIAIAIALTVPAVSFGQSSNGPLTRAQVRAQLIQLEHAGYYPGRGKDPKYPSDIQAAEARVAAQSGMTGAATGIGGTTASTTESGHRIYGSNWNTTYCHH
ncbi:DUF4148 domain-containing protein [Paraburkholderia sp. A3BS-1L]|uniref:DUF4148 domain-containing protein n=1 Tax=Paraburkholderia sp. A3BS-1L TaxID=3028375 RepID=UPI003DA9EC85